MHKAFYAQLRADFGLTTQAAVRSIAKVADAGKINRKAAPVFQPLAAQPYDERIMRFVDGGSAVFLGTMQGRIVVPIVMGERQWMLMAFRKGEADLCFVGGKRMLACPCDVPETWGFNAEDWLGLDLGIGKLAMDSDGTPYTGDDLEKVRSMLARRKAGLQKRGTKAAKRCLKPLARKAARFRRYVNHCISKAFVDTAKRTGRSIALEDLKHIHSRGTDRHGQQARLQSWSSGRLCAHIAYKVAQAGVPIASVDPADTSTTCSRCGKIDNRSRPNQATFSCAQCGHAEPIGLNAAQNIQVRATVTAPLSSPPRACAWGARKSPSFRWGIG